MRRRFHVSVAAPMLVSVFALTAAFGTTRPAAAQTVQAVTEVSSFTSGPDGRPGGPGTAIAEATLKRAGLDYRVAVYPWARAYDMALHDPDVLIYLLARTADRESLFHWVGEVAKVDAPLYRLRKRKDVVVNSLDDARRYRIGVTRGDARQDALRKAGFSRLVVSAQDLDTFRKLLNNQVDLIPLPERDAIALAREAGEPYADLEKVLNVDSLALQLWLAFSRPTSDDVVARTRAAFDDLKAHGVVTRLLNEP